MNADETTAPLSLLGFLLPGLCALLGGALFAWWAATRLVPTRATVQDIYRLTDWQRGAAWYATLTFTDQHGQEHTVSAKDGPTAHARTPTDRYTGRLRVGEEADVCYDARNPQRVFIGSRGFQIAVNTFAGAFLGFFLGMGLVWLHGRITAP